MTNNEENEETDQTILLTTFISVWGWQILAILFLSFSFLSFSMPRTIHTFVFFIAFFVMFISCEYVSLKKRKKFYDEN